MTDRLNRVEGLLEKTAERLDQTADQQAKNTEGIDTLLGVVAKNEADITKLVVKIDESNDRFEVLRSEAANDRQETRQLFNDAIAQMEINQKEGNRRFDEVLNRIDAQQEVIQRLLVELLNTNRDTSRLRDRVDGLEQAS